MIRTILATAITAAAVVTFSTSAAFACLSCEYKPEVLGSSAPAAKAKPQKRERMDAAVKSRRERPEKERVVERKPHHKRAVAEDDAQEKKADLAKAVEAKPIETAKPVEAAATPTVATEGSSQPTSTISHSVYNTLMKTTEPIDRERAAPVSTEPTAAAVVTPEPLPKKIDTAIAETGVTEAKAEPETAPAAKSTRETVSVSQDKGDKTTGCKKFFPMADLTLTVDCGK